MPLFVAQHRREPADPAADADWAARLRSHVSAGGASYFGVAIQADALIAATSTLLLIVEAVDIRRVERFMAAFAPWGSVEVYPASPAEEIAEGGHCLAQPP